MRHTLIALFLVFCTTLIYSQQTEITHTPVISTDVGHGITKLELSGTETNGDVTELYYSFTHPGGGVQKVAGSLGSGGKEPTDLPAFGHIRLTADGSVEASPVKWLKKSSMGRNVRFYADPLDGPTAFTQTPLAEPGDIAAIDSFNTIKRGLNSTNGLSPLALPQGESSDTPSAQEYYNTTIYVGMGGGLTQVATIHYTLKSEADRNKLLSMSDYESKTSNNKDGVDGVFGADNISYKWVAGGDIPTVCDPVSGNALVIGGIKYKKDKTKEYSQFFEFRLFTFDKNGELLKAVNYDSEEALLIKKAYPIYGKQVSGDVQEVTHVVVLAQGGGHRKMSGINTKLYRVLVIDIKTGELVAENETMLSHPDVQVMQHQQLADGKMQFLILYPGQGPKGLALLTADAQGYFDMKEYGVDSPELAALNLSDSWTARPLMRQKFEYPLPGGGRFAINELYINEKNAEGETIEKVIRTTSVKYDENGGLLNLGALDIAFDLEEAELLSVSDDTVLFYEKRQDDESEAQRLAFIKINIETLESTTTVLTDEYKLLGSDNVFFDQSKNLVCFFTTSNEGKGLYLSQYQL